MLFRNCPSCKSSLNSRDGELVRVEERCTRWLTVLRCSGCYSVGGGARAKREVACGGVRVLVYGALWRKKKAFGGL
jgi:hypothetical protein